MHCNHRLATDIRIGKDQRKHTTEQFMLQNLQLKSTARFSINICKYVFKYVYLVLVSCVLFYNFISVKFRINLCMYIYIYTHFFQRAIVKHLPVHGIEGSRWRGSRGFWGLKEKWEEKWWGWSTGADVRGRVSRHREPDTILRAMRNHGRILNTGGTPSDLCLEDHVDRCAKIRLLGTDYKALN